MKEKPLMLYLYRRPKHMRLMEYSIERFEKKNRVLFALFLLKCIQVTLSYID